MIIYKIIHTYTMHKCVYIMNFEIVVDGSFHGFILILSDISKNFYKIDKGNNLHNKAALSPVH